MTERDNREEDKSSTIFADNHEWSDRVAVFRQKQLERIGAIVIITIVIAVVVLSLW
ncbi:MAG: hypothetical protein OXT06_11680 [Rhodospirillaceae bacterium]|nr:hypothetical protein [Rhodospirillaceae bacterium]MDD9913337.1 hypothetical protein [Rhodospirillaceae bacterium]MDD9926633.1 hypothetical protein [Rhodospirillaceae bacterium]